MSVYRIYVEKKPEFAVEAASLISGIKSALGLEQLTGLRVVNRYDAQGLSKEDFALATPVVFSEPAVDVTYDHLPQIKDGEFMFAVEYLPGQFDQRADSCAQCISLLTGGKRPVIKSARIYIVTGNLSDEQVAQIKSYMINPVES
ncbi:MAG: phosphoribosylformylglycinamidine synthase, partial [Ruminococcus sp.]|nr:phosphoribosylformylglycinamidine synthase [Ruminococcus sp.]